MVEFWCFVGGAFCGSVGLLLYATILALIDHRQRIRRQSRDMLRWLDEQVKQPHTSAYHPTGGKRLDQSKPPRGGSSVMPPIEPNDALRTIAYKAGSSGNWGKGK